MIYGSEIAAKSVGMAPRGTPHIDVDCHCAVCGRPITRGTLSVPKDMPRTFCDGPFMHVSDYLCGYCSVTTIQTVMRNFQRSVITEGGVYNLNTDASRAWFWRNPPPPPFVLVINNTAQSAMHYFWRIPVTLDVNLVQMCVDGSFYQVNRLRLLKAVDYAGVIVQRMATAELKRGPIKSPFVKLERSASDRRSSHGLIRYEVLEFAKNDPACKEAVDYLSKLTPGELLAISCLVKVKDEEPQPPVFTPAPLLPASAV